ncbi:helix-turn-helix domain-containing protein [Pseudarthrobacter phenanthrenivorans]|uniref:helix-turn-helix domain-containing protein n=1 Tax=Pseudarthrobacter phenanthrenivorans TaxID=361575 RepID=UPI001FE88171|nr:helix-turn-helix domain-containing protein [Pseudarthrobacter phenanthrenivorans]
MATLCLDLDTSKALKAVVDSDAANLRNRLSACGVAFVEDFSPSGGRHLYIPLQERLDASEARELVEALALTAASLDPSPHQNVTDGCIRVPGSAHKSGGYQVLITPLSQAYDVLRRRNPAAAIAALHTELAPELARNHALKARQAKTAAAQRTAAARLLQVNTGSETPLRRTARTGLYDTARYKSPSEARMAVLNHFSACGWTLDQVQNELTGQFPGLAALYGTPVKQNRLIRQEWAKAEAWTRTKPHQPRGKDALINNTSPTKPTGGASNLSTSAIHQLVSDLENVLYAVLDHRFKDRGREGLSLRFLIRALLAYMRTRETDLLDVGCRTLAAAMGKHHVTIARLLPALVEASDGILTKVADARRKAADVYLIQLPEHYQQLARELTWRKGKIHSIRPVFRVLGDASALVYETIERGRYSPTSAELIRSSGISRSTVEKALTTMENLGMVHRDGRHWKITATTNLRALAERLGAIEDYQAQISRNRRERAAWHAYLDRFMDDNRMDEANLYDPEREEHWIPPDDSAVWLAA